MKTTFVHYPQPMQVIAVSTEPDTVFFAFEEDFVEENVRCIPMIVRFKLDVCGIKLKLSEWSKLSVEERKLLSELPCSQSDDLSHYRIYLQQLILKRTGAMATDLAVELNPEWQDTSKLPLVLLEKLKEFSWHISMRQWTQLSMLQRFVLLKLCRAGHENANFPKAMQEFGLV